MVYIRTIYPLKSIIKDIIENFRSGGTLKQGWHP
jgi:hypothetical protein